MVSTGRKVSSRASKRELESSLDWHAALRQQFEKACHDVISRQRPVRRADFVVRSTVTSQGKGVVTCAIK